jgi:CRISPR/Cas system CMR-associated protein Cmr5 small subunit
MVCTRSQKQVLAHFLKIGEEYINKVRYTKFLRIMIDDNLKWHDHIKYFLNFSSKNIRRTKWQFAGTSFKNRLLRPLSTNLTITKGPVHVMATRDFVDYVINNKTALAIRSWVKKTAIPDETFFSTLNYNPQLNIPGSHKGKLKKTVLCQFHWQSTRSTYPILDRSFVVLINQLISVFGHDVEA